MLSNSKKEHRHRLARWIGTHALLVGLAFSVPAIAATNAVADAPQKPLPAVTAGEATVVREMGPNGREGFRVDMPAVNAQHPVSEATIGSGPDQINIRTYLVQSQGSRGNALTFSNTCSATNPGYCTCISDVSTGVWPLSASFTLQTSWNWDGSTVWANMGNNASGWTAGSPLWWQDVRTWMSGTGTESAYSDGIGTLKDGFGWFSITVYTRHMWHNVDAWGNCYSYFT